ncbi:hypothetical protein ABZ733_06845 [Streptomyces longwoodensis]|uniref:hypothetical protein n=1 Tax=Streptomyces longwoodensis TaxID=68231 RepID=UPI0033CA1E33
MTGRQAAALLRRLTAETIPQRPATPPRRPWTPEEQDAHWTALCAAVGTPDAKRPTTDPERHTA